jgi:hypothetical protein
VERGFQGWCMGSYHLQGVCKPRHVVKDAKPALRAEDTLQGGLEVRPSVAVEHFRIEILAVTYALKVQGLRLSLE